MPTNHVGILTDVVLIQVGLAFTCYYEQGVV